MEAAHAPSYEPEATSLPNGERLAEAVPERSETEDRRCLVTGEVLPKDELIRFVVGPADVVFPDLAHTLPGRGLWVKADHAVITMAAQKGLFAKAAKAPAKADVGLADQTAKLLRSRCLDFAGMAKGAGLTVLGQPQVETALRAKKLGLLLLADDASAELDNRYAVPECRLLSRDELGAALGYAQIVYAGLKPHKLTNRLKAELHRLAQITKISPQYQENR